MRAVAVVAAVLLVIVVVLRTRGVAPRDDTPRRAVPADEVERREAFPRGVVSGTVSGKDGPLAAVLVAARVGGSVESRVTTGLDGRYRLEVLSGIDLEIEASPLSGAPARRTLRVGPGEEATADFAFGASGTARVHVSGSVFPVDLVAVRSEDYPAGDPPPIAALEAAPKVAARLVGVNDLAEAAYEIMGLDLEATYRPAVLDRRWALEHPTAFGAGDTISVRLVPAFRVFVEARDLETGEPLATFRASVTDRDGTVLETLEGREGRLSRCLPLKDADEIVLRADGYLDRTIPADGVRRVGLVRARPPNVLLRIAYDDGTEFKGEIEAQFESLDEPDGLIDATIRREGGVYRAVLPLGRWRLHVKRPDAFQAVTRVLDLEVPAEADLRYARGGTLIVRRRVVLEREIEGEWVTLLAGEGTWEDAPPGSYRVDGAYRFEVAAGTRHTVE